MNISWDKGKYFILELNYRLNLFFSISFLRIIKYFQRIQIFDFLHLSKLEIIFFRTLILFLIKLNIKPLKFFLGEKHHKSQNILELNLFLMD